MKFVQIDEEGFPLFDGLRVQDKQFGKEIVEGIRKNSDGRTFFSEIKSEQYILEAFDQPLVGQMVFKNSSTDWEIEFAYGVRKKIVIDKLTVDEWDRFHGRTEQDVPYVFSRKAQNEFFNLVDEFDDYGFYIEGEYFKTLPYWASHADELQSSTWSQKYLDTNEKPRWDLGTETPILRQVVPQLKIPKSRILVLGCGRGHDAHFFAKSGHVVTAVDFSEAAIEQAQKLYGGHENLKFTRADVFHLPENFQNHFDIIFDHTLFCAIDPVRRSELVKIYKNCLHEHGNLLGIFFTMDHMQMAPFGGTEWEYRERLKNYFQFLYWTRWRGESARSPGSELVIYARKI